MKENDKKLNSKLDKLQVEMNNLREEWIEHIKGKLASIEANVQNTFKFISDSNMNIPEILSACYKHNKSEQKVKLLILPSRYCETDKPILTTVSEDDD